MTEILAITATLQLGENTDGLYVLGTYTVGKYNDTDGFAIIQVGDHVLADTNSLTLTTYVAIIDTVGPPVNVVGITDTLELDQLYGTRYSLAASYNTTKYTYNDPGFLAAIAVDVVVTAITDSLSLLEISASIAIDVNIGATTNALIIQEYIAQVEKAAIIVGLTDTLVIAENTASISQATSDRRRVMVIS